MFKIAKDICDEHDFSFEILKPIIFQTILLVQSQSRLLLLQITRSLMPQLIQMVEQHLQTQQEMVPSRFEPTLET